MTRELTIYRNPVPGTLMKRPLACIDLDPSTNDLDHLVGRKCYNKYSVLRDSKISFVCPGHCVKGAFLYPRHYTNRKNGEAYFHFHQGIDLGVLDQSSPEAQGRSNAGGLPIYSVTSGIVTHIRDDWELGERKQGYGNVVGIFNAERQRLYWYAHLQDVFVREGMEIFEKYPIASVGNTGKAGGPHLHFEVLECVPDERGHLPFRVVKGGEAWERELGKRKKSSPRLDPLRELAALGPWGAKDLVSWSGDEMAAEEAEALHTLVESGTGGFFPLGINNFWHGGVHIPVKSDQIIHTPFDGKIIALRLGATEDTAHGDYGSINFILVKHEISMEVFERMQVVSDTSEEGEQESGESEETQPPPPPKPPSRNTKIGLVKSATNPPDKVIALKKRLAELGYYEANDDELANGEVTHALIDAVAGYQETLESPYSNPHRAWPDRVVSVPGHTWNNLFPPDEDKPEEDVAPEDEELQPSEEDPKRVIYGLVAHLAARSLSEVKRDIPWVTRAELPSSPRPPEDDDVHGHSESGDGADELAADEAEAKSHTIRDDVTLGSTDADDIRWVEARLIRLGFLDRTAPTATADQALFDAIVAFQIKYPWPGTPKNQDGVVSKTGKTVKYLRLTGPELEEAKSNDTSKVKEKTVDAAFMDAVLRTNDSGHAVVVSGLDIDIEGGAPLWLAGGTAQVTEEGSVPRAEVHVSMFSQENIFPKWSVIDDPDDDLLADAPGTVLEDVDINEATTLVPKQTILDFYRSEPAKDLRRTACRFRSEWGAIIEKTLTRLEEMGVETEGVESSMLPYPFWEDASDVLPEDPHVWHYNPIEFLHVYQSIIDAMKPPPPPDPADRFTHGHLSIKVKGDTGMAPKQAVMVMVTQGQKPIGERQTGPDGIVTFYDLFIGQYEITLKEVDVSIEAVIFPADTTEVELETSLEGKPVPRGSMTVWVRKKSGGAGKGAILSISGESLDHAYSPVKIDGRSKAIFEDLQPGTYTFRVTFPDDPQAHPNDRVEETTEVEFDGKSPKKIKLYVPRGWTDIRLVAGPERPGLTGTITSTNGVPIVFIADAEGNAYTRIERGKAEIKYGRRKQTITAYQAEQQVKLR